MEDEREERKGINHGRYCNFSTYFPLVIVGMVLVIMWGMSAAGSRPKDSTKARASDIIHAQFDEGGEIRWDVVEKEEKVLASINSCGAPAQGRLAVGRRPQTLRLGSRRKDRSS